jgi:hypothetical protein
VFTPSLVIVSCGAAEGAKNALEIVSVLQPDMFFDEYDSGCAKVIVFWNTSACDSHHASPAQ